MALATQCPHCQTRFRVASDQLKLRGGIVRCGACQRIFDGSAHLIGLDAPVAAPEAAPAVAAPDSEPPAPASIPAAAPEPEAEPSPPEPEEAGIDFASQPVYTLDFNSTFDPLGILPKAEPAVQDPEPPHGDVLAHAVEASVDADLHVDVDLPPLDPEPPHGDMLSHALDAAIDVDLPPLEAEQAEQAVEQQHDPEPPHGDMLAHALDAAIDVDLPPPEAEETGQAVVQPQNPETPHGDALAHAVDTVTFVPPNRIEPRLEPDDGPPAMPQATAAPLAPPAAPVDRPAVSNVPPVSFVPPGRIEPSFELPVDEELVAQPLRGHAAYDDAHPDSLAQEPAVTEHASAISSDDTAAPPSGLPLRASAGAAPQEPAMAAAAPASRSARAKAAEARARRTRLTPTKIEAPKLRVPETDEPEFVKRSRKQEQSGRTRRILLGIGAFVLLLVLASQLVLNFRNVLAARYPGARPALEGACALLGCRVELPTQIDNLAIENGELTTLGPDTYSLNTLLRNQGSLVQAWPSIELELTDTNDKPVLRRVFAPGEYLPQGTAAAGFNARSEQPIKLHFALADLKPSGYHIFIFYP